MVGGWVLVGVFDAPSFLAVVVGRLFDVRNGAVVVDDEVDAGEVDADDVDAGDEVVVEDDEVDVTKSVVFGFKVVEKKAVAAFEVRKSEVDLWGGAGVGSSSSNPPYSSHKSADASGASTRKSRQSMFFCVFLAMKSIMMKILLEKFSE